MRYHGRCFRWNYSISNVLFKWLYDYSKCVGAPLYALMILVVSVKLFGFLRAITRYIERLLSHKTTFTMLRNVRVQFLKMLYPVVPDIYRRFNSSDLITK